MCTCYIHVRLLLYGLRVATGHAGAGRREEDAVRPVSPPRFSPPRASSCFLLLDISSNQYHQGIFLTTHLIEKLACTIEHPGAEFPAPPSLGAAPQHDLAYHVRMYIYIYLSLSLSIYIYIYTYP